MCQCNNIQIGSMDNSTLLGLPWRKEDFRYIDNCIIAEIQYLWSLGIKTCGNCCGHNVYCGSIMVKEGYEEKMEKMNYIKIRNSHPGGGKFEFLPKSVSIIPLETELILLKKINFPYIDRHIQFRKEIRFKKYLKKYRECYENIDSLWINRRPQRKPGIN